MKYFYTKGACSFAGRIIANELSLPLDYEEVDLQTKKTKSGQDFLKINPKGAVPAIMLNNGEVLTENAVILQYLASQSDKGSKLFPAPDDFKHYRVLEWLNFITTELHKGIGIFFKPDLPAEAKEKFFLPMVKAKLEYVDKHLANHTYLLGDSFTLPDAYLFVMLMWTAHFKIEISSNLKRYFAELKKRPSVMESLSQEGLQA